MVKLLYSQGSLKEGEDKPLRPRCGLFIYTVLVQFFPTVIVLVLLLRICIINHCLFATHAALSNPIELNINLHICLSQFRWMAGWCSCARLVSPSQERSPRARPSAAGVEVASRPAAACHQRLLS